MNSKQVFSSAAAALLLLVASVLASCTNTEDTFQSAGNGKGIKVFDFSTIQRVELDVILGQRATGDVICLFPSYVTAETMHERTDMLYSCYLDSHGSTRRIISLPASLSKVYLISATNPSLGCMEATVHDGVLQYIDGTLDVRNNARAKAPSVTSASAQYEEDWHILATYAFEDLWPIHCDYDLNDVIVEHWQKMVFTNQNIVRAIYDVFKLTSTKAAASYHDAFYVQIPANQKNCDIVKYILDEENGKFVPGEVLAKGKEECIELDTRSLIVFEDQHDMFERGIEGIYIVRTMSGNNVSKDDVEYNPFVISQASVNRGVGRTEIHLPCYEVTQYSQKLDEIEGHELNYFANRFVSERGVYPFALALYGLKDWKAPNPSVRINETFIYYDKWRKSNGQDFKDWYINLPGYDARLN
ncbi:MAG: LruC domain-containing protein [Bacteroidaceae bacterium]|nr:LruC domain-containing protein [Bacteroidaceae bacterium]